jgi:ketosteroid isomerase-like protein
MTTEGYEGIVKGMLSGSEAETQIRELVRDRIEANRAKDALRATRHFADDVVIFDVVGPLYHRGIEGALKRARDWFGSFDGPLRFDVAELQLQMGVGFAVSSALNHVQAVATAGELDMWWRCTTCYCLIDGSWKIVHEHNSVPFDPLSGKASLDLRPK